MLDNILSVLKKEKIENYLITETNKKSVEMFFIKHELDMTRNKDVTEYKVTVFHDEDTADGKLRGSANCFIHYGMEKSEIAERVRKAYTAAGFALNPFYELQAGKRERMVKSDSSLSRYSLDRVCAIMSDALFKNDVHADCYVNSAEVFACKNVVRIVNSLGLDVAYEKYWVEGEFVTQCINPEDIELYKSFSYDELATDELSALVSERLLAAYDRSKAKEAPKSGEYTVVIQGGELKELLNSFYAGRSNAAMIYPKYSSYEVGTMVQGDSVMGELLNASLWSSVPYSAEGIKMTPLTLIENGKLLAIHGNLRMCSYLNVTPTGEYDKFICDNGSKNYEDMINGERVLVPVVFSDFSVDELAGRFAGEMRLAYLYENGTKTILTGGSISGSILEGQTDMVFSKERYSDSQYQGPLAVRFNNVSVAGV